MLGDEKMKERLETVNDKVQEDVDRPSANANRIM
jgi:hypothetical protein